MFVANGEYPIRHTVRAEAAAGECILYCLERAAPVAWNLVAAGVGTALTRRRSGLR
jgi:hypothetical protein